MSPFKDKTILTSSCSTFPLVIVLASFQIHFSLFQSRNKSDNMLLAISSNQTSIIIDVMPYIIKITSKALQLGAGKYSRQFLVGLYLLVSSSTSDRAFHKKMNYNYNLIYCKKCIMMYCKFVHCWKSTANPENTFLQIIHVTTNQIN